MGVRAKANQRAQWCEKHWQRNHQRDQPRRNAELNNHHAVERAGEKRPSHSNGHLEQRQT